MNEHKDEHKDEQPQASQSIEGVDMPYSADNSPKPRSSWLRRYGFSLVVLGLCIVMGYYIIMQQNKSEADETMPAQGQATDFTYADSNGNNVTLSETNGKARLLYFFFASCPDVCPPTTALMSKVQDELKADGVFGSEVEFLSVTIDPDKDTPEVLKDYAERFDADPSGWRFLRGGDQKETADLARKYQIDAGMNEDGSFYHMNLIVLLDKKGQIRDWISLNEYMDQGEENLTPADMAKKIKSLI